MPVTAPGWVRVNWLVAFCVRNLGVGTCQVGIELGQTEIKHFDQSVFRDHDVSRLEIAMYDAGGVRLGKRVGDLNAIADSFAQFELAILKHGRQSRSADVLHDDEVGVALGVDFINSDDVGMIQSRRCHGLALKAAAGSRAQRAIGGKNFDSNIAVKPGIVGAINHAHSACSKIRENVVVRQPSANQGFVPR